MRRLLDRHLYQRMRRAALRFASRLNLPFVSLVALAAMLGSAGCATPAPTPGQPMMPTTSRMQKADDAPTRSAPAKPDVPVKSILDLASYTVPASASAQVSARICATVNTVPILDNELREAAYPQFLALMALPEPERSARRKEVIAFELEQLVEREVILQEMFELLKDRKPILTKLKEAATKDFEKKMRDLRARAQIKNDDEFKAFLRSQGISLEGVRRQEERKFMAMEFMRNMLASKIEHIGHDEIETYYNQHPEEFQVTDSVSWQDIFLDANRFPSRDACRQFADKLATSAFQGEDFAKLVKQYDQGDSSYRDGAGCGKRRGEIKPLQAEALLFQMKDGDIGPVIELETGFHVIKLVKREYAGTRPLDEKVQEAVRNKLRGETWEREYKKAVVDLRRKATVEISSAINN